MAGMRGHLMAAWRTFPFEAIGLTLAAGWLMCRSVNPVQIGVGALLGGVATRWVRVWFRERPRPVSILRCGRCGYTKSVNTVLVPHDRCPSCGSYQLVDVSEGAKGK